VFFFGEVSIAKMKKLLSSAGGFSRNEGKIIMISGIRRIVSRHSALNGASAAALALGLGAVAPLGAMAQDGMTVLGADEHGTVVEMDAANLLERAAEQGSIRVIVGLDMEFAPYGELDSAQISSQEDGISSAQNRLMSNLSEDASVRRYRTIPFMAMEVDATDLEAVLSAPGVSSVQEEVPDVPLMNDTTLPDLTHAAPLWAQGSAGEGHSVVVLDTGARVRHNSFRGPADVGRQIAASACFSTNSAQSTSLCPGERDQIVAPNRAGAAPECDTSISGCGHGTHVSGIAVGNQGGNHGMARDADLIPMQVFADFGGGVASWPADQIAALERSLMWRDEYNIAAVNMSLGGGRHFHYCDNTETARTAIIENLRSVGIATVIASGNDSYSDSTGAPACISSAITVGSSTKSDEVSWFSNQHSTLDLMAPGSLIRAASADGPNSALELKSGTSMAAPHVAGGFAMLKSHDPDASVTEIERALACTGIPVTRGDQPHPRISMTRARNFLDNPHVTRGWGFGVERQVNAWREVLGQRDHQGDTLRLRPDGDAAWSIAQSPFCVNDVVVSAQLVRNDPDPDFGWNTGMMLSSVMDDDGKISGLFFGFNTVGGTTTAMIIAATGTDGSIENGTGTEVLCEEDYPAINMNVPHVLQAVKQRNDLQLRLNGQVVCTAETTPEFRNGRVALVMASPTGADADGHSTNLIRAIARPLNQSDPVLPTSTTLSSMGGASRTGEVSASGFSGTPGAGVSSLN
jgi:subtilisin